MPSTLFQIDYLTTRVDVMASDTYTIIIMNIKKIQSDFPIFRAPKAPKAYLDNAATTHKPQSVIDAMSSFYSSSYATVHRSLYEMGEQATQAYEDARATIATFFNADCEEIIFTKGTTESINFVATAWGLNHLKAGDEILLTMAEHHANLIPWQQVAKKTGAKLVFIPIDKTTHTLADPLPYLTDKTKLIAAIYYSNILGPIWQAGTLEALITEAKKRGARILLDTAQATKKEKIDVKKLGADFITFSGHKMYGPTGIGGLYINKKLHGHVEPYQFGGSMIYSASFNDAVWAPSPQKYEAGTPNIVGVIGMAETIRYLEKNINFDDLKKHMAQLSDMVLDRLHALDAITIVGNQNLMRQGGSLICFDAKNIHAHDLAAYLGSKGIALRTGHHCVQPLVNHLGFESLLRVSFGIYTTQEEVQLFLDELEKSLLFFKQMFA